MEAFSLRYAELYILSIGFVKSTKSKVLKTTWNTELWFSLIYEIHRDGLLKVMLFRGS